MTARGDNPRRPAARGTAAAAHRMPVPLRDVAPALLRIISANLLRYPNGSYMTDLPTDRQVLSRLAELSENELRWIRSAASMLMALAAEELVHRGAPATQTGTAISDTQPGEATEIQIVTTEEFDTDGE